MERDKRQMNLPGIVSSPKEPKRIRLPDSRQAVTHKFTIIQGEEDFVPTKHVDDDGEVLYRRCLRDLDGYVTLGLYDDGRPGELFLKMGKAGGLWRAYDALMVAISVGLQYGVPVEVFIRKFQHMRFAPSGFTKTIGIEMAKSVPDYLARWLKTRFPLDEEEEDGANGMVPSEAPDGPSEDPGGTDDGNSGGGKESKKEGTSEAR